MNKNYAPLTIKKIDFGEGVYCYLTDNEVLTEQAVITLHGAPGQIKEWVGLEA